MFCKPLKKEGYNRNREAACMRKKESKRISLCLIVRHGHFTFSCQMIHVTNYCPRSSSALAWLGSNNCKKKQHLQNKLA